MIKIIEGDLLTSDADVIAHQVNCSSAMNSGVAKQIRMTHPYVYKMYKYKCSLHKNHPEDLLGECLIVKVNNHQYVANLFGQLGYGYDGKQYTDLDALERSMVNLKSHFKKDKKIAFPYGLGSVRGGAKWEDVYRIIDTVFDGYNIEIWKWDRG